ncbi:hypothetical protein F5Y15DRAFT_412530 [Xylariaceae sp. FL0016]|nr:hypothetical protein F5Y15DRAFT_412530 [Xylariaceae sp. FL0016]
MHTSAILLFVRPMFFAITLAQCYVLMAISRYIRRSEVHISEDNGRHLFVHFMMTTALIFLQIPQLNTFLGYMFLPCHQQKQSQSQVKRHYRKLWIVIVSNGYNMATTRRTVERALASNFLPKTEVVLLTDEQNADACLDFPVRVINISDSFQPPRARYKARALEFCRRELRLEPDDWILHLDEETMVDVNVLEACDRFIAHESDFEIGQGFVFYNKGSFWGNWLLTVADLRRVADDMGKLFLQNFVIHRPYWGLRGSFLLLSGDVENRIGWDSDCLTEDYEFSWKLTWVTGVGG